MPVVLLAARAVILLILFVAWRVILLKCQRCFANVVVSKCRGMKTETARPKGAVGMKKGTWSSMEPKKNRRGNDACATAGGWRAGRCAQNAHPASRQGAPAPHASDSAASDAAS